MSTGSAKERQTGERDGAKVSQKGDIVPTRQKVIAKETAASKEKAKDQESVITAVKLVIGQDSALTLNGYNTRVIIVVKKVIRQPSASCPKEEEKGKECTR